MIFDEFGGCFENFETFNYIFDSCTKDHCCLIIKTTGNGMSDQVFWYKAATTEIPRIRYHLTQIIQT
jgi:hypothetical protein